MSDEKAAWTPPEDRRPGSSPLGPSDLEYLDRLVQMGEGLLMEGLQFSQAEALLRTGHAKKVATYNVAGATITRIVPTEAGETLARIREDRKLKAMLSLPKEKT